MPQPVPPSPVPSAETIARPRPAKPRARRVRRRSDRLLRIIAIAGAAMCILVSTVTYHQSRTIESQRLLIRSIFKDSIELNGMRQREIQQQQEKKRHPDSSQAQPAAGPYADGCIYRHGLCT